jgi:hypothetical protein
MSNEAEVSWDYFGTSSLLPRSDQTVLEVKIPSSNVHFIDLKSLMLVVSARVLNKEDKLISHVPPATKTGQPPVLYNDFIKKIPVPSQFFLFTMFQNIQLLMSNRVVFEANNRFGWLAYLSAYFGFNSLAKKSHMTAAGYNTAGNRREMPAKGEFTLAYPMTGIDVLNVEAELANNVDLSFRFTPQKPELLFTFGDPNSGKTVGPKLEITKLGFMVRRLAPKTTMLSSRSLSYPFTRQDLRYYSLAKDLVHFQSYVYEGTQPKFLRLFFITEEAFGGTFTKNTYEFEPLSMDSLQLTVGTEMLPNQPLVCNMRKEYENAQVYMYNVLQQPDIDLTKDAVLKRYDGSAAFRKNPCYQFNISDVTQATNQLIQLTIKFSQPLPKPYVLFILYECPATLHLDNGLERTPTIAT